MRNSVQKWPHVAQRAEVFTSSLIYVIGCGHHEINEEFAEEHRIEVARKYFEYHGTEYYDGTSYCQGHHDGEWFDFLESWEIEKLVRALLHNHVWDFGYRIRNKNPYTKTNTSILNFKWPKLA